MVGQIIDYIPAGALPATPRAGVQELIDTLADALQVHDDGCCSDLAPCRWRTSLQIQHRAATKSLTPASTQVVTPDPEPIRPQGSGQISRRTPDLPASEKQLGFIGRLISERTPADLPARHARTLAEIQAGDPVSLPRAADLITALLATARIPAGPAPIPAGSGQTSQGRTPRTPAVTEDGMYRTPDGQIYKVQTAIYGSGRLYAKKLVELATPNVQKDGKIRTHGFEMAQGAIDLLTPAMKMTRDDAREFGRTYGTCCRCGLTLTDETSIDTGLGTTCRKKF